MFVGATDARFEVLVLSCGTVSDGAPVLTRIHSSCLTGDALGSLRCDCGAQLRMAMRQIAEETRGLLLYLPQEGRGIGLANKIRAYALQDNGRDTVDANLELGFDPDMRNYDCCKSIFSYFKVNRLRLMTNNPHKVEALGALGVEVVERVALSTTPNTHNMSYLRTKRERLGHILDI